MKHRILIVLHQYLVKPLQVLIQASCGIVDCSADPADELDVLLKASHVTGSSISSLSSLSRDCRGA